MQNLTIPQEVAQHLLSIKAIQLRPDQPFTWASGWNSPIYCDNRITLSYPIGSEPDVLYLIMNSELSLL